MNFRITGIDPEPYRHLFGLPDAELARHGAVRVTATEPDAYPDRVELRDALPGETLLLLNYRHQDADTPYRASHAIFVLEGAAHRYDACGQVPAPLRRRLLSVRAFDGAHMMADADVAEGKDLEALIARLFADPAVAYLQVHYARRGCYAARVERA